jgi:integrase/recombinase XerD
MYVPIDIDLAVKRECKRRRYSNKTIKTYLYYIYNFLNWSKKDLRYLSKKDVKAYLQRMSNKGLAGNTMNTAHMAIKFLFEDVMDRKMGVDIKYSKVPKRIQRFLTKDEVERLLKAIKNPQHRLMVALMYSAGLRVSEVINLKVRDLNFSEGYGFVRNGKGGKDRVFVLSNRIDFLIEDLCLNKGDSDYVFLTNRGRKYSIRSLQAIVRKASKLAEIFDWKSVHPHTLRHSFATHLVENNYTVSDVQASLGHKSPETSMTYVHGNGRLIGIKSPLDF